MWLLEECGVGVGVEGIWWVWEGHLSRIMFLSKFSYFDILLSLSGLFSVSAVAVDFFPFWGEQRE
jgi:hypothetical protein